jgi:hypothetical protein
MPGDVIAYPADAAMRLADRLCDLDPNLPFDEAQDLAIDMVIDITTAVDKLRAKEARP